MQTLVIYDIPNDRIRNKVAERCKDAGLERIQYSAFIGDLNHNRREQLQLVIRRTVGEYAGNIRLYPLCDKDMRLMKEIAVAAKDTAKGTKEKASTKEERGKSIAKAKSKVKRETEKMR